MIYARTVTEVDAKRRAFLRKWRLHCRPVVNSLDEAVEKLFTFLRFPSDQWKSIRTTNAIERLHKEFKRRIKTQCMLPCADTACMLFWALLASEQITLRKSTAGRPCMSPLPSKFLIWWHKPITSPLEMTAIGNFHQVHDATVAQRSFPDDHHQFPSPRV